ncbi:MAG: hypothetical protein AAFR38_04170 [Planctomycetota bacterium]
MIDLKTILCPLTVAASLSAAQPSLTPPAGPVSVSGRDGTRIELSQATAPGDADSVFRISTPGSYVLTRNLVVPSGMTGIEIATGGVSIDLNGFEISGAGAIGGSPHGIAVPLFPQAPGPVSLINVSIENGSIRGFFTGIDLDESGNAAQLRTTTRQVRIERVEVSDVIRGIDVNQDAIIRACQIDATALGIGIAGGVVSECSVRVAGVGASGVAADNAVLTNVRVFLAEGTSSAVGFGANNATITNCHVQFENAPPPVTAFSVADSHLRGCTAIAGSTQGQGFSVVGSGAHIESCTAIGFGTAFDVTGQNSLVRGCAAIGSATPAILGAGVVAIDNTF